MKYVQKHFWKEHLCALQVFLCALFSSPLCARVQAQLRGNIARNQDYCLMISSLDANFRWKCSRHTIPALWKIFWLQYHVKFLIHCPQSKTLEALV